VIAMTRTLARAYIENYKKLFRAPSGKIIKKVRASTLARNYWCQLQAYYTASGVEFRRPKGKKHAINIGSRIHKAIDDSRKPSKWEKEFLAKLQPFIQETADEGVELGRKIDDDFLIEHSADDDVGWLSGHPDELKVNEDHTIHLIEYKTKRSANVNYYSLAPAEFQIKIYSWIMEPILSLLGYRITKAQLVFLDQKEQPIGTKEVVLNYELIEKEIRDVLMQWRKEPKDMIPPARWKCRICPKIYRTRCPYAN